MLAILSEHTPAAYLGAFHAFLWPGTQTPPFNQITAGSEGNPLYDIYWLAKDDKGHETIQTRPNHLPQGAGTYPITMTPCKHTCTHSII